MPPDLPPATPGGWAATLPTTVPRHVPHCAFLPYHLLQTTTVCAVWSTPPRYLPLPATLYRSATHIPAPFYHLFTMHSFLLLPPVLFVVQVHDTQTTFGVLPGAFCVLPARLPISCHFHCTQLLYSRYHTPPHTFPRFVHSCHPTVPHIYTHYLYPWNCTPPTCIPGVHCRSVPATILFPLPGRISATPFHFPFTHHLPAHYATYLFWTLFLLP